MWTASTSAPTLRLVAKGSLPFASLAPTAAASGPPASGEPRQSYHHGNLRASLIDATLDLVAERGPHGFTLREVARRAGVSHTAPYRHFPDRAALVAAAAERAFAELGERLRAARAAANELGACAAAYVGFALEHPARFAVMCGSEAQDGAVDGLKRAVQPAFEQVLLAARQLLSGQADGSVGAEALALAAWANMHGIAVLAATGRWLPLGDVSAERAASDAVELLCAGALARTAAARPHD